jgi:tRNA nucleotidyltransferase/poly(A) polymerase
MSSVPAPVRWLWGQLNRQETTWMAGGAVRDRLLGQRPQDYDLATRLHPELVQRWARWHGLAVVASGAPFGRLGIVVNDYWVDVTTFRREAAYPDARHPEGVQWTRHGVEDLRRRDFTVNAMALTWEGRLVDPWGGREDAARTRLRTVGPPAVRLQEDLLRIWRACRFLAYEPGTWAWDDDLQAALVKVATDAHQLPRDRIAREIEAAWRRPYLTRFLAAAGRLGLLPPWPPGIPDLGGLAPEERLAVVEQVWQAPGWGRRWGLSRRWVSMADVLTRRLETGIATRDPWASAVARVAAALKRPLAVLPWTPGELAAMVGLPPGPAVRALWAAVAGFQSRQHGVATDDLLAFAQQWMEAGNREE